MRHQCHRKWAPGWIRCGLRLVESVLALSFSLSSSSFHFYSFLFLLIYTVLLSCYCCCYCCFWCRCGCYPSCCYLIWCFLFVVAANHAAAAAAAAAAASSSEWGSRLFVGRFACFLGFLACSACFFVCSIYVVFGIAPQRGSWFYHYFWKVVFDEQFFLRCEVSQSIAPATQNEVPCPMILNFFIFIIFWRSLIFFLNAFFVCVVLWSVTIYCACHTKWGSSSLVSSCLHVQFLFDEVLFSFFFRLCGLCDVSQSIAPATQNHVPCPMILNFYVFYHFVKNDEFAFFYSRSLLVATTDDVGEK